MSFFNIDPSIKRFPPEKVHFRSLVGSLDPEGKKVRVQLELTPFQKSPFIELTISDSEKNELSTSTIVEPVFWKQELTMHLRSDPPAGSSLKLIARVYYPDTEFSSTKKIKLAMPIPSTGEPHDTE